MILQRILYGVLVIIVLVLVYFSVNWAINNIESYEREEKSGLSARARRNDFLAADYFLKKAGIAVKSVSGRSIIYQLPSIKDSLLIADIGIELSENRQQAVEDWINRGGHLITTTAKLTGDSENNILQKMFTIKAVVNKDNTIEDLTDTNNNIVEVPFADVQPSLKISIDPRYSLEFDEAFYSDATVISSEKGIQLVQINIGEGLLTVISDIEFLKNGDIGLHDHAYLLWLLVNKSQKLWLLYSNNTPSLWVKAWKFNAYLMFSAVFLCLLFFWSLWHRFGPPEKNLDFNRRDIMQQLSAVGRFHMKADRAMHLLNDNRKSILLALEKKHPGLRNMHGDDEIEWLSRRVDVDSGAIREALDDSPNNDMKLVKITRVLQRISKNT